MSSNIQFEVTAPGKIILFGEHSVVYGKPAIACAIDQHTTLTFTESYCNNQDLNTIPCRIILPLINYSGMLTIHLDAKPTFSPTTYFQETLNKLNKNEPFLNELDTLSGNEKKTLTVLHFIFGGILSCYMKQLKNVSFTIGITSVLKLGAGTGSSASYCVSLVAACLAYVKFKINSNVEIQFDPLLDDFHSQSGDNLLIIEAFTDNISFSDGEKCLINRWALLAENFIHTKASGLDNTICTYGTMVQYTKLNSHKLLEAPELKILLIYSGIERSTGNVVQSVRTKYNDDTYQPILDAIFNSIGQIVNSAVNAIDQMAQNPLQELQQISVLQTLMDMNQGLLMSLGVSHETLDAIVAILKKFDLHAKLTGAGMGGYAICLVPPNIHKSKIQTCMQELKIYGFESNICTIGCPGVRIQTK
ncbi:mevalonate kinase [Acyrthosiphon pisum]|uniref:Mevalonate kinase n=1 Tax=Acyrthosiphon pisum TaxID=7029 RepID=A0A8R1VY73_ACYPI|nr:mevalonate kinase [Acyrthosiphon pisum]XP_060860858.1 mevalonate kinase [Metopolophium dirhodum]|eukprot:XP_001942835.1 PREDICTED: mevalonate kinase isoform X2 [Acyrthosiphon pisum]